MTIMGRPTAFRPELCEQAHNYCLLGATNDQLADFFDVCPSTIDNWIARHSEFGAAVKAGRLVADAHVARGLFERATGYDRTIEREVIVDGELQVARSTVHYPANVQACLFWLRNRQPGLWNERRAEARSAPQALAVQDVEAARHHEERGADHRQPTGHLAPHDVADGECPQDRASAERADHREPADRQEAREDVAEAASYRAGECQLAPGIEIAGPQLDHLRHADKAHGHRHQAPRAHVALQQQQSEDGERRGEVGSAEPPELTRTPLIGLTDAKICPLPTRQVRPLGLSQINSRPE